MRNLSKFFFWTSLFITASCTPPPNHTIGGNLNMSDGNNPEQGENNPVMLPTSPSSQWSCKEVYNAVSECYSTYSECARSCENDSCAAACEDTYRNCAEFKIALGSAAAQSDFNAARGCEETNFQSCYDKGGEVYGSCLESCTDDACRDACANEAGNVLKNCMQENCRTEYGQCGLLESTPGDTNSNNGGTNPNNQGGGTEPFNCGQLYDCEDACAGNRSCGQRCYDNATETAKSQWSKLIQCGQTNCDGMVADAQEYRTCLEQRCNSDYGICFGTGGNGNPSGGGPQSGGASGCGRGYMCVQGCYATANSENDFYSCVDTCYDQMSSQGHQLMEDLVTCSRRECTSVTGSVDNYFRCQRDLCPTEYSACLAD